MATGGAARGAVSMLRTATRAAAAHGAPRPFPPPMLSSVLVKSALRPVALSPRQRRTFASSSAAAGWIPSFQWGKQKEVQPIQSNSFVEEHAEPITSSSATPFETAAPSSLEAASPSPPPAPLASVAEASPSAAVADAASTVPSSTEPTFHLANSDIYSGSLDLTSLAGSFGPHPIMRLQSLFLNLHESFPLLGHPGLPWFILIPTVTLLLRLLLFGFQIRAQANAARMALIQPQMLQGMEKLKAAKNRGDFTGAQAAQLETQALMSKHNVNPIRNLVFPLAQATVFMTMFFAIKGLAGAGLPSLTTEGLAWVQDLTKPDPYWALPVASTALTLATLETGVDSTTQVQTTTTKNVKMAFRAMLVVALPFIGYFPAALLLYWVSNNFLSLIQSLLLKQNAVRKFFNIPIVPPKPQPGQPGYVPEPSFSDAFKNMQIGMKERWEETKEKAEAERARKEKWEGATTKRAEVYIPQAPASRQPGRVEQVARGLNQTSSLLEQDAPRSNATSEIRVEAVNSSKEAERARRVQAARQRRRQ